MAKTKAFLLIGFVLFFASTASATVEYARQTGEDCRACHVSRMGGGDLTASGEAFKEELRVKGLYRPLTNAQRMIRLIIGYLHMFTAVIWFGTILYVHIVLKPAYAAGGLPRGELKVGWISMPLIAITGTLLALARVPSFEMLYTTRFGVLLMIKIVLFLIMFTSAAIVTFSIGPKLKKKRGDAVLSDIKDKKEFTAEELSRFDGKEGRPALVAFEGKVYDLSKSKLWKNGEHLKKHWAGTDLTGALKGAPHGPDKLSDMPLLGTITAKPTDQKRPGYMKLFYFFAYMNLVFVFLILFVISLWRWW